MRTYASSKEASLASLSSLMTFEVEGLQSAFQLLDLELCLPSWPRQWEVLTPCKELRVDVDLILVYSQSFANEKALQLGSGGTCLRSPGTQRDLAAQGLESDRRVGTTCTWAYLVSVELQDGCPRVLPEQCLLGQVLPQHVLHLSQLVPVLHGSKAIYAPKD